MDTAAEILVIIVSVVLSFFLLALLVLVIHAIRLVKRLDEIVDRAEKMLTSAESIGKVFRKTTGPVSLFNFVRSVVETVAEHKQKGEK